MNKPACKDSQSVMGHFKGTVKVHGAYNVTYKTFRKNSFGLGAISENLSSVAPPGKKNYIDIMCKVYIYGAWKTMLYYVICGQFLIISL